MLGKLRSVSEENNGKCRDILWKFLYRTREIVSMSNDVVLLNRFLSPSVLDPESSPVYQVEPSPV